MTSTTVNTSGLKVRVNFAIDAQGKIAGANVRPE